MSQAYNAAQSEALDEGLLIRLNKKYPSVDGKAVFTCMPDRGLYTYPDFLLATGALREIIDVYIIIFL